MNFENIGILESTIDDLKYNKSENWINYPKSMIWAMKEEGFNIQIKVLYCIFRNNTNGAGLSSSASIEVLQQDLLLKDLFDLDVDMTKIALQDKKQRINTLVIKLRNNGSIYNCKRKKDCLIFLDTANLEYEYAPVKLENAKI